ncbi:MAG: helix-turn-helix domain-containing protein [Pirellulaceae bacterium]
MVSGVFSIPLETYPSPAHEAEPQGTPRAVAVRQYIGSDENRLVEFAVQALLTRDRRYNPVLFVGPSGTGKSLLALGLAERWRRERVGEFVVATCGADFARSFAYALDTDSVADWRARHGAASLFVLDDLQQMDQKPAAQEELARLLDQLLDAGQAVLVTASQTPAASDRFLPGLCSRLSGGLSVPLHAPGVPARRVLLRQIADLHDVRLSDAAIEMLAEGPTDAESDRWTVPQLNHAVVQLSHAARLEATSIELDEIRLFWKIQAHERQPTLRLITGKVAKHFSVTVAQLRGPSRRSYVVRARGVAMWLARTLTSTSLESVGTYFGDRDHTTVLHACRKTESLRHTDPAIARALDELAEQLSGPLPHRQINELNT